MQKVHTQNRPKHIAIIMDGNGRWAEARGQERREGHRAGVEALRRIVKQSEDFGIRHLTYDERKVRLTNIATRHLTQEIPYERKHDIADAICMIEYYNFKNSVHFFDRFRYKK